ncbi:MAG: DUF86 domain-containing protein [Acidobacteria bacterium]|nr:DUF86 domain-containing protein [Acidobacteriota bacterium]
MERIERKGLQRFDKLQPGVLAAQFPAIGWRGAMGSRDVIAHQYFDLDDEQVLLICRDARPGVLGANHTPEALRVKGLAHLHIPVYFADRLESLESGGNHGRLGGCRMDLCATGSQECVAC